ncbi:hypothetical protein ASD16_07235 [Cellulomonas sp. Root485]|uniref:P-loop NTPase fold protein n=1 Tax=Cellulomonas sp. Root485 TaxID=1736546 RepID=UPI0006F92DF3|nr:P-loop NTPase fold protein [Cellulomonas sp. Root485]KQY25218.1 hypothetical protein ASD16_07235 [Cellulomonas sp. Root485]
MAGSAAEGAPSVQSVIAEAGRSADALVTDFARAATAVQRHRYATKVSDSDLVTRSTAVWVLTQLDPQVGAVLQSAGLDAEGLGAELSISRSFAGMLAEAHDPLGGLHPDFADALRLYLEALPKGPRAIGLPDLATAIVQSGRNDSRGLLPRRLTQLGMDYDSALSGLRTLMSPEVAPRSTIPSPGDPRTAKTPAPTRSSTPPPPLSETMRGVAAELTSSSRGKVTAFDIAAAIARRHPEYAGDHLGGATLAAPAKTPRRSWAEWLDAVGGVYDRATLKASRHTRLDGRLFLTGLGVLDPELRAALDASGVWAPLLVEVDDAVAPAGSLLRPYLEGVQFSYGYSSDRAGGVDQLGVQGEVNAVCEVITDPHVQPPLAIGLFGEWGTGKSFFMDRMRERVAALTAQPRAGASPADQLQVVQIRFNAWHYADTSLWASLAVEIFERLADPEPVDESDRATWLRDHGDSGRSKRQAILTQLQTFRDAKAALESEQGALKVRRVAVEQRRAEAARQRRQAVESMPVTDVAGELAKDAAVQAALRPVADELGFAPAADEVGALAAELRTTAGYLHGLWRVAHHKVWAVTLAAVFVVLVLATLTLVVQGGSAWIASVITGIGSVSAALLAAVKVARPAAQTLNRTIADLQSARAVIAGRAAELRSQRSKDELMLEVRLAELDDEITGATRLIAELDEKIATATTEAEALAVGRQLYDFLADRAAGYQKHQGVVGMLHRDFRFLDAQFRALQAAAEPVSGNAMTRIDRVILYIDDLDRCPPAKVLEVLEAVHLLLALELFVVVVGVDPRWLQRSLRHQYRDLVTSGDPTTDAYLRVMPIEYLEKIFQIPLTLPAMEPTAFAQLIASIAPTSPRTPDIPAPPTETPAAPATPSNVPAVTHRASTSESPGGDRSPVRGGLDVQAGSSASGAVAGPRIDLTPAEIQFAQTLGPLVASPRAAKRLMNTYRLIRATRHVGSHSRFLGGGLERGPGHSPSGQPGEYQAVLTLLAIAAGYPTMADRIIVALQLDADSRKITTWPDFVRQLDPANQGTLVPSDLVGGTDGNSDVVARDDLATWTNLHAALAAALASNQLSDLTPYQYWCGIAARFSFTL